MDRRQTFRIASILARFPQVSITPEQVKTIIKGFDFISFEGIQSATEVFGEDVILLRHKSSPKGAVIGIRASQLSSIHAILAAMAQLARYQSRKRTTDLVVPAVEAEPLVSTTAAPIPAVQEPA